MKASVNRVFWSSAALIFVVGGGLFLYALQLGFTESLYSQRGSFAFFMTVTEPVIRSFPVVDAITEPQYHAGCGDGPKPPDQAISYNSRLSVAELSAQARRHIAAHGYVPTSDGYLPGDAFSKGEKTLYLSITTAEDGTSQVHVLVWL